MAVKGPDGNALYKRSAGHGFKLAYSIVDGSVIVQDVMKKTAPSQASAAKKSKAGAAAKAARASGVKRG